jgi:hypothetical protein
MPVATATATASTVAVAVAVAVAAQLGPRGSRARFNSGKLFGAYRHELGDRVSPESGVWSVVRAAMLKLKLPGVEAKSLLSAM